MNEPIRFTLDTSQVYEQENEYGTAVEYTGEYVLNGKAHVAFGEDRDSSNWIRSVVDEVTMRCTEAWPAKSEELLDWDFSDQIEELCLSSMAEPRTEFLVHPDLRVEQV